MNLCFFVMLALVLPSTYLAMEVGQQDDSSVRNNFVFPKDRKNSPKGRIVGGEEVTPHSYPFQAGLLIYTSSEIAFCGGTLITRSVVLTAAHCVSTKPLYILVILGAHDLSSELESDIVVLNATSYVYHRNWNEETLRNDIALVRLPINVTISDNIQVVPWANGTDTYEQNVGTAVGWGETEVSTDVLNVLKHVNATIMTNEACAAADINLSGVIISSHLCISGQGIKGTCSGDSGGPLLVDGVQVGIVSFGFLNCTLGKPSVFTRVSEFNDWILDNLEGGSSTYENLYYSLIFSVALTIAHLFKSV